MTATAVAETPTSFSPEVLAIAGALDVLLTELIAYRAKPKDGPREFQILTIGDIMRHGDEVAAMTPAQAAAHRIIESPMNHTLKRSIRELGKRLNEISTDRDFMLTVAEHVASLRDGSEWGRRISIIDATWDGIGDWHS